MSISDKARAEAERLAPLVKDALQAFGRRQAFLILGDEFGAKVLNDPTYPESSAAATYETFKLTSEVDLRDETARSTVYAVAYDLLDMASHYQDNPERFPDSTQAVALIRNYASLLLATGAHAANLPAEEAVA